MWVSRVADGRLIDRVGDGEAEKGSFRNKYERG